MTDRRKEHHCWGSQQTASVFRRNISAAAQALNVLEFCSVGRSLQLNENLFSVLPLSSRCSSIHCPGVLCQGLTDETSACAKPKAQSDSLEVPKSQVAISSWLKGREETWKCSITKVTTKMLQCCSLCIVLAFNACTCAKGPLAGEVASLIESSPA